MLPFLLLLLVLLPKSSSASKNGLSDGNTFIFESLSHFLGVLHFNHYYVIELHFIHQEMRSLREENKKQNYEIASLKETVQLQNKTINQHEKTIKELISDDLSVSSGAVSRRKRPARLLPSFVLRGKKKNETINQENGNPFYGPPTNCSDLARLGYTLNGFYQIKFPVVDDPFPLATKLDTVYCAFKQEGNYNPFLVQIPIIPFPSSFYSTLPSSSSSSKPNEDISFYASISRNPKSPYYGTLQFGNGAKLNIGNHFNPKTGLFKSPKVGIYHFSYEMTSFDIKGNETRVNFYLNDILVANTFSSFSDIAYSSKIIHQVTLKLNFGDTICLKATNKENSKYVSTKSDFLESLTGYLLRTTPV